MTDNIFIIGGILGLAIIIVALERYSLKIWAWFILILYVIFFALVFYLR